MIRTMPDDATHQNPRGIYAVWYKQIGGVWHYWAGLGFWKMSLGLTGGFGFNTLKEVKRS